MSQTVVPGVYYYQIDDTTHAEIVALAQSNPNSVWTDLLAAFDYQSPYVPGKWYAPVSMIDTDDEVDWAEETGTSFKTYWFRTSLQPGNYI